LGEDEGSGSEAERESLLAILDSLIRHINSERFWFNLLIATSLIASPVSLLLTLILLAHPVVLRAFFRIEPVLAPLVLIYLLLILVLSSVWLLVGAKEYRFLSDWNRRFTRYFSLKQRLELELRRELERERGGGEDKAEGNETNTTD